MLLAIVVVVIYAYILQHRMHELSETTYRAGALRNATLIESLTALETIKTQGAESVMQSKWEKSVAFVARVNNQMRFLSAAATNGALRGAAGGQRRGHHRRRLPDQPRRSSPWVA